MKKWMELFAILIAANALFVFIIGIFNIIFELNIAVEDVPLPYQFGELALWSLLLLLVGGMFWLVGNLGRIFKTMGKAPGRSFAIATVATALLIIGGNFGLTMAMGGPVQRAIEMGNTQALATLLETNTYASEELSKPLYFALKQSNYEMAKSLVESGANVNYISQGEFDTPLLLSSVFHFEKEAIAFLLTHGADINTTDNKGRTAMDIAETYRPEADKASVIKMLSAAETTKQP